MKTIKLKLKEHVPEHYTGIIEWENGPKYWYKEGKLHRLDGPACEFSDGYKQWWIEGKENNVKKLFELIQKAIYLGAEKGNHNLCCLRFLTENQGIQEFPIIPGMEKDENFKPLLLKTLGT